MTRPIDDSELTDRKITPLPPENWTKPTTDKIIKGGTCKSFQYHEIEALIREGRWPPGQ